MLRHFYNELETGQTMTSQARTITETDIVMFAALTGDWYPLHTDKEWAKNTLFKQRIAHGMLVFSLCFGLIKITPGVVIAFYGIDQARFTAPTFIGDTIHVESEVLEKLDKGPNQGLVTFKLDAKNQKNTTILTSILKILLNKKLDS